MGFMDSLKKATGLGLSHAEHFERAYEKGVLLGPAKYSDAVSMFETAARKATEAGDTALATRATASALLYKYVATGSDAVLEQLKGNLENLADIESVGSRTETIPAATLVSEIEGRLLEIQLASTGEGDYSGRAQIHQKAADSFKKIFTAPLLTYKYHSSDGHTETAQSRFFLHQGGMAWALAQGAVGTDPDAAAEHAARALAAFRQCKDEKWSQTAETWLNRFRTRRTCWMCHREVQGMDVHCRAYPATVTPYLIAVVTKLGHDTSSLDAREGQIILCAPCGTSVERQADSYASRRTDELRSEVAAQMSQVVSAISELQSAVTQLQAVAHTH